MFWSVVVMWEEEWELTVLSVCTEGGWYHMTPSWKENKQIWTD
jgi:hypothetical protein